MPTKEMFRFKVCRQVSVPIWSVEINSLRLFCIASHRVEKYHFKTCMVLATLQKAFGSEEGITEHSQGNIQCIYNIVTSNLSSLMVQNKY